MKNITEMFINEYKGYNDKEVVCLEIILPRNSHSDLHVYEHSDYNNAPDELEKSQQYTCIHDGSTLWLKIK